MKRLIIDTETTGFSPHYNKTLTVGMVLADVEEDYLKILDEKHIFIKHQNYNASSGALKVNGINLEEHNNVAVPPKMACNQINSFIKKNVLQETPVVGHNLSFDTRFLMALFDQAEANHKFHHETEDTMFIWRNLQRRGRVPMGMNSKLGTVASHFNIDYEKAHDALADCHITAQVYHNLMKL